MSLSASSVKYSLLFHYKNVTSHPTKSLLEVWSGSKKKVALKLSLFQMYSIELKKNPKQNQVPVLLFTYNHSAGAAVEM